MTHTKTSIQQKFVPQQQKIGNILFNILLLLMAVIKELQKEMSNHTNYM